MKTPRTRGPGHAIHLLSVRCVAILVIIVAIAALVTAPGLRDAVQAPDMAAPDNTAHPALNFAPAAFEFHFGEIHPEPARTDLTYAAALIEIDIAKSDSVGFIPDRCAAGPCGPALHTPLHLPGLAPFIHIVTVIAIAISIIRTGTIRVR